VSDQANRLRNSAIAAPVRIARRPPPAAHGAQVVQRPHAVHSAAPVTENAPRRWLSRTNVFFLLAALFAYLGWRLPTERYLTPETGLGYTLGIVGGSLMLVMLLYSARKRIPGMSFLGSVTKWFDVHVVLGVLGPLCILYHANFSLGATNSNVALMCMLIVVGSGFIGRYIYSHIHFELYGRKLSLGELQASAERLRALERSISFLPELVERLETEEKRMLGGGPRLPVVSLARPLVVFTSTVAARWRLRRYVRKSLRAAARVSPTFATQRKRLKRAAQSYIDKRLVATRRVAAFEAYERLFSVWHVLHLPLIFMLLIAGVVHVIAVHVY
jgi:hypothetical protein